jgi:acetyl-CoA acetyltransferase
MMREPITVEDVLNSRLIAWPIHLLECCLVTDGGGALILTTAERARDFKKPPVYILGTGEGAENMMISSMHDFTESRAFKNAATRAFAQAGIERSDIDHLMLYDAFAQAADQVQSSPAVHRTACTCSFTAVAAGRPTIPAR